jgi:hypothetical protein
MPEPPADSNEPEQCCPAPPRRVVADWEYRTAYIPTFQVRITAGLHDRLCEWAKQARGSNGTGNWNETPRPEAEVSGRPPREGLLREEAPVGGGEGRRPNRRHRIPTPFVTGSKLP